VGRRPALEFSVVSFKKKEEEKRRREEEKKRREPQDPGTE
jgi:hypothetical protein